MNSQLLFHQYLLRIAQLWKPEAGHVFQRLVIKSIFDSGARQVFCAWYRQKEDTVSAGELDLHATDLLHVHSDFSLTRDSLLSTVKLQGKQIRKTSGFGF